MYELNKWVNNLFHPSKSSVISEGFYKQIQHVQTKAYSTNSIIWHFYKLAKKKRATKFSALLRHYIGKGYPNFYLCVNIYLFTY